jgi:hypothetical protein
MGNPDPSTWPELVRWPLHFVRGCCTPTHHAPMPSQPAHGRGGGWLGEARCQHVSTADRWALRCWRLRFPRARVCILGTCARTHTHTHSPIDGAARLGQDHLPRQRGGAVGAGAWIVEAPRPERARAVSTKAAGHFCQLGGACVSVETVAPAIGRPAPSRARPIGVGWTADG